jgi:hypothetical protein
MNCFGLMGLHLDKHWTIQASSFHPWAAAFVLTPITFQLFKRRQHWAIYTTEIMTVCQNCQSHYAIQMERDWSTTDCLREEGVSTSLLRPWTVDGAIDVLGCNIDISATITTTDYYFPRCMSTPPCNQTRHAPPPQSVARYHHNKLSHSNIKVNYTARKHQTRNIFGASRWQPGALPSTASKVGILGVIVHNSCIAMHGPALRHFCVNLRGYILRARSRASTRMLRMSVGPRLPQRTRTYGDVYGHTVL